MFDGWLDPAFAPCLELYSNQWAFRFGAPTEPPFTVSADDFAYYTFEQPGGQINAGGVERVGRTATFVDASITWYETARLLMTEQEFGQIIDRVVARAEVALAGTPLPNATTTSEPPPALDMSRRPRPTWLRRFRCRRVGRCASGLGRRGGCGSRGSSSGCAARTTVRRWQAASGRGVPPIRRNDLTGNARTATSIRARYIASTATAPPPEPHRRTGAVCGPCRSRHRPSRTPPGGRDPPARPRSHRRDPTRSRPWSHTADRQH